MHLLGILLGSISVYIFVFLSDSAHWLCCNLSSLIYMYRQNHNEVAFYPGAKPFPKELGLRDVKETVFRGMRTTRTKRNMFPNIWYHKVSQLINTNTTFFLSMFLQLFWSFYMWSNFYSGLFLNWSLSINPLIFDLMCTETSFSNLTFWMNATEVTRKKKMSIL